MGDDPSHGNGPSLLHAISPNGQGDVTARRCLWPSREVGRVAKETGLATQMGNQGHSTPGIRDTVELLRAGAIGTVREIHAWVGTKRWNPSLTTKPIETTAAPAGS